jgi:dTDP-4-dehydrorhamnose 3,5-epimerase
MVRPDGTPIRRLIEGMVLRRLITHVDERGSVTELLDHRWRVPGGPIVFSYMFSIRPGIAKGWNLHKDHAATYCLLSGAMALVLYEARPESTTYGEVCRPVMHEYDRCLVTVPRGVWHADHNIGSRDAVVVNYPTIAYEHAKPDKYRLPLDTSLIPYRFPPGTIGG